jgi:hypothetical protein
MFDLFGRVVSGGVRADRHGRGSPERAAQWTGFVFVVALRKTIVVSGAFAASNRYWLQVRRSQHRLVRYRGERVLIDVPAAIGSADTPTPGGPLPPDRATAGSGPEGRLRPVRLWPVRLLDDADVVQRPRPDHWHPRHQPAATARHLGQPRLCPVRNCTITRLAKMLPLGTPVQITA